MRLSEFIEKLEYISDHSPAIDPEVFINYKEDGQDMYSEINNFYIDNCNKFIIGTDIDYTSGEDLNPF